MKAKYTPPTLAARWGTSQQKVLRLINTGQLRAVNLSEGTQRPRWFIDAADVAEYESRRANRPAAATEGNAE